MKSFLLFGILFLTTSVICAQETFQREKGVEIKKDTAKVNNYTISVGLNIIDNGRSSSPFNAETMAFKTPFFIGIERRFESKWSLVLAASTNRLTIASVEKFYISIEAAGQFYFDDYIFKNEDIEMYAGLGLGRYFLENNGSNTMNVIGGGRYWFSDHYGISLQGCGKVGLTPINESVRNHYQYNLGLVWRI